MEGHGPATLAEALSVLKDPRRKQRRAHELVPLLLMVVAAMFCGAKSLYAAAQWGRERREDDPDLLVRLGLKRGKSPSYPTIHRVFKGLDVAAFERVLGEWLRSTGLNPSDASGPEVLAIDGKSLRGIHGEEIPGVHLVALYSVRAQAVLAQTDAGGKGRELNAVKALLGAVPPEGLSGAVVTGDALQAQREVCDAVTAKGGRTSSP
jgi:DDE_Tnp_1-associated